MGCKRSKQTKNRAVAEDGAEEGGISQDKVALKSGITQATISRLESGGLNFRIGTLESYVDAQ